MTAFKNKYTYCNQRTFILGMGHSPFPHPYTALVVANSLPTRCPLNPNSPLAVKHSGCSHAFDLLSQWSATTNTLPFSSLTLFPDYNSNNKKGLATCVCVCIIKYAVTLHDDMHALSHLCVCVCTHTRRVRLPVAHPYASLAQPWTCR